MTDSSCPENPVNSAGNFKNRKYDLHRLLRLISLIIPLAVLGNIIYAVLATETDLSANLSRIRPPYLLLAVLLVMIPLGTHSLRLMLWSRAFKVSLKPVQAFKAALISDIGSAATPTIVGGGYVKLFFMIGYGFSAAQATLVMILGTIEDVLFFAVALPLVIIITRAWDNPHVITAIKNLLSHWPILLAMIVGVSVIIIIYRYSGGKSDDRASRSQRVNDRGILNRLKARFRKYRDELIAAIGFVLKHGKGILVAASALAGIGWTCRYVSINALLLGLGFEIDPLLYTLLHWVVFSTMTLIPTPGAIGGAEVSFGLVFSGLLPAGIIPVVTGLWRFVTFYFNIACGAAYLAVTGPGFSKPEVQSDRRGGTAD